jgi:hypothetical protein
MCRAIYNSNGEVTTQEYDYNIPIYNIFYIGTFYNNAQFVIR